jgi:hypothetical protein
VRFQLRAQRRHLLILLAPLGAALFLAEGRGGDPAPAKGAGEPKPPGGLLTIPAAKPDGAPPAPLDWILGKLSSREDGWAGEAVHERIVERLHKLEELILEPERRSAALEDLLAPGFQAGPLSIVEEPTLKGPLAVAWRGAPGSAARRLEKQEFPGELSRFLAPLSPVRKAKFKVYRVDAAGPPRRASSSVLLEMDGDGPSGRQAQLRADLEMDWQEEGEILRISRIDLRHAERAEVIRRPYTDVTEEALGANRSYQEQLRFGLDHWRTRIDAASGIEIYGHQGIAVGDVDGDGREDFYVAQPAGLPNRLFRALGNGAFEDITSRSGVGILDETGAVLLFDADNDGDPDLLAVTPLELLLFENEGAGRFSRRTGSGLEAAANQRASMIGAAVADYDLDGDLDLYVVSYVFWAGASSKASSTYPFPYHDAQNGAPNFLFRNDGGLHFTDVTVPSGMDVNNRRFSLAASWCDYDDDGDPDLYVANDFGRNNLYRNNGDSTFNDVAAELGVEDVGNGMSVAWADYDGDGREDLYVGNMWSSAGSRLASQPGFRRQPGGTPEIYARMAKGNTLFRNLGGGRFEDVTERAGVGFGRWAWSSQFLDVDGDGNQDLYILNGFITGEKTDDL